MFFTVIDRGVLFPEAKVNSVYLRKDRWNDYDFQTLFQMVVYDEEGLKHYLGDIKIGFKGQTEKEATFDCIDKQFDSLDERFFSLGQSDEFYEKIYKLGDFGRDILNRLNDIVIHSDILEMIKEESVLITSLMRGISISQIKGQFERVLSGQVSLTDYIFEFFHGSENNFSELSLSFNVKVESTPTTNIHAIIGRNGVGKTTILNNMIKAIIEPSDTKCFYNIERKSRRKINQDYFHNLISVSFSVFDPFSSQEMTHKTIKSIEEIPYFYIGLKDSQGNPQNIHKLSEDCSNALELCLKDQRKLTRWQNAIETLFCDGLFASMGLLELERAFQDSHKKEWLLEFNSIFHRMSSGHKIIFLTITRLVAVVEEKTLILMDEPESHLHPPLLSAFIRALSELLLDRNGVAIIATHSPVVLQEIPRSCVQKIYRIGSDIQIGRPEIETFGENVGLLTSEVFGLEVTQSGFYKELEKFVSEGLSFSEIIEKYSYTYYNSDLERESVCQLGFEGRAILKAMIVERDRNNQNDETI